MDSRVKPEDYEALAEPEHQALRAPADSAPLGSSPRMTKRAASLRQVTMPAQAALVFTRLTAAISASAASTDDPGF